MTRTTTTLTELAKIGFADLGGASEALASVPTTVTPLFGAAADPDQALRFVGTLRDAAPDAVAGILAHADDAQRLLRVLGASEGMAAFLVRHPEQLAALRDPLESPLTEANYRALLKKAVARKTGEGGWNALRIAYRRELLRLAAWDLEQASALAVVDRVGVALADLAGAALDASLTLARAASRFPAEDLAATKLAIIGMGKAGARELNYLSDVDVIFVTGSEATVAVATRLAMDTMKGIADLAVEPPLWEVDANLRPEGKDGALVRSLDSHIAYYERWAKSWEFQALLKARPLAGDRELGEAYVARVEPFIWSSASREGFVDSVQRMRERVTA
ncbi:MAG: bifunctional glutamine-synthetase adenylyltransferase/deadenyltransferase, partial [Pseudolysinimonas sp.]